MCVFGRPLVDPRTRTSSSLIGNLEVPGESSSLPSVSLRSCGAVGVIGRRPSQIKLYLEIVRLLREYQVKSTFLHDIIFAGTF
jgi:hypothetical protein